MPIVGTLGAETLIDLAYLACLPAPRRSSGGKSPVRHPGEPTSALAAGLSSCAVFFDDWTWRRGRGTMIGCSRAPESFI